MNLVEKFFKEKFVNNSKIKNGDLEKEIMEFEKDEFIYVIFDRRIFRRSGKCKYKLYKTTELMLKIELLFLLQRNEKFIISDAGASLKLEGTDGHQNYLLDENVIDNWTIFNSISFHLTPLLTTINYYHCVSDFVEIRKPTRLEWDFDGELLSFS